MKRTSIMLPQQLKMQASQKATRLGISLGEFIRKSLLSALRESQKKSGKDPLFADGAVFHGKTPKDLSKNHDDYLYGGKSP